MTTGTRNGAWGRKLTAALLAWFGALTLVKGGSVLFDVAGARAEAGAVVPIVLRLNFLTAFLYLAAAPAVLRDGLFPGRTWALRSLMAAVALLVIAAVGLTVHVLQGGAYEQRTLGAMAFRLAAGVAFYAAARRLLRREGA